MFRTIHGSEYRWLVMTVGQPLLLRLIVRRTVEGPLATPDGLMIVGELQRLVLTKVAHVIDGGLESGTHRVLAVPLDASQSSTLGQLVALAVALAAILGAILASLVARSKAAALLRLASGQILLLVLDATILEPNFHLLLGQPQIGGDLDATQTRQVHVGREFALEFQQLSAGEGGANALGAAG